MLKIHMAAYAAPAAPVALPVSPLAPTVAATAPNTPPSKTSSPAKFMFALLLLSVLCFSVGLAAVYGYSKVFSDSSPIPPAPRSTTLGALVVAPTPLPTPTPNTALIPELVDKPLEGTLAFIQANQIYTIKADRTLPDKLTDDTTLKQEIATSPNGEFILYTFTDPSQDKLGTGLATVTRSKKTVTVLVPPGEDELTQPRISNDNLYATVWVNQGKESWILKLDTGEITLRYGTTEAKSISPMVWIPGLQRVSFVLVNELFGSNVNGDNLRSFATNVLGLTSESEETPPNLLPPVWSKNGRLVAFHKEDGLYVIDTSTNAQIPIESTDDVEVGKKAPFKALGFTNTTSHLLYANALAPEQQTTFLYSFAEKKSVPVGNYHSAALIAGDQVIGMAPEVSDLNRYSLKTWENAPCTGLNPSLQSAQVSPNGSGIYSLDSETGIAILTLTDIEACVSYEVAKAPSLRAPVWLPN